MFSDMKEHISVTKEVLKAAMYSNIQVAELGAMLVLIFSEICASISELHTEKLKI